MKDELGVAEELGRELVVLCIILRSVSVSPGVQCACDKVHIKE